MLVFVCRLYLCLCLFVVHVFNLFVCLFLFTFMFFLSDRDFRLCLHCVLVFCSLVAVIRDPSLLLAAALRREAARARAGLLSLLPSRSARP